MERRVINIIKCGEHFVGVANLNRVMNAGSKGNHRVWCERCLRPFYVHNNPRALDEHRATCYIGKRQVEIMPAPSQTVCKFSAFGKMESPLFVAYADTECILVKQEAREAEEEGQKKVSHSRLQRHEACAVDFIVEPDERIKYYQNLPMCVGTYRQFVWR